MIKKVIFAAVELVLIAIGTGVFVNNTLARYVDAEEAAIGAFMVVSGLLFRGWKNDFFNTVEVPINKPDNNEKLKEGNNSKYLISCLLVIFAFTFWGLNHKNIKKNTSDISSAESNINTIENKVDNLVSNSHYH